MRVSLCHLLTLLLLEYLKVPTQNLVDSIHNVIIFQLIN